MAAAGHQAEEALAETMKENFGKYLLAVDGSIPTKDKALLLHRRQEQLRRVRRGRQGRRGDRLRRHLLVVRRHPRRDAEPDRRASRSPRCSRKPASTSPSSTYRAARRSRPRSPACSRST